MGWHERGAGAMSKSALSASLQAAIAKAVASGDRHDRPIAPTIASIHAEAQQLRRKRMQEAGIKPIRIPKQPEKLQIAIRALVQQLKEGRAPSAKQAAKVAGLAGKQATKLAYQVSITGADVTAATCLIQRDPFIHLLEKDAGWKRQVVGGHKSLAALARTIKNAHLSLAGKADQRSTSAPRARGDWHADARALRAQGWTGNRIARHLNVALKTVETFLSRDKKRGEQAPSTPYGVV